MYDIAAILINYNSSEHTINCVRSIVEHTSDQINFQIVIVDNCSERDDYEIVADFVSQLQNADVSLHRSRINTGFGGGNMFGVQFSNANYLAFVNNDTLFKNDCFSILTACMRQNPDIAIAGAQAYKGNGEFMISLDHFASPAREILGRGFLEAINPKKYPKRKKKYEHPVKVNFVPGSFMFIKAADFYEVGGFDTNIFLYYEETDLCLRLAQVNKSAYLVPEAEFVHFHGVSTGKTLAIKKELKISLLYIIRKHYGFFAHKFLLVFLSFRYLISSIFKPRYWSLFALLISGAPISKSLRTKQKIAI